MKNFKFDLNAKVAIYVPSTTDVFVNKVMTKFSEWFGGCTSTPAVGGWVSNSGALVVENVTIVYAFCTPESFGDHFEAGLEYYRRETRPATEAEEKEAVKYLRARNYTHFKLSKRCTLKR